MEKERSERHRENNLFRNSKHNHLDKSSLYVCFQHSDLPLCPSWWTVCPVGAEQRETDSPAQVSLRAAAAAAGGRGTEVDRKTLKLLHFLQSPDHINRQKALWLHWTALKRLLARTHRASPPSSTPPPFSLPNSFYTLPRLLQQPPSVHLLTK